MSTLTASPSFSGTDLKVLGLGKNPECGNHTYIAASQREKRNNTIKNQTTKLAAVEKMKEKGVSIGAAYGKGNGGEDEMGGVVVAMNRGNVLWYHFWKSHAAAALHGGGDV